MAHQIEQSIVYLRAENPLTGGIETATGFYVTTRGHIITAGHFLWADAAAAVHNRNFSARFHDEFRSMDFIVPRELHILSSNASLEYDVAFFQMQIASNETTMPLTLGNSREAEVTDIVMVTGFPRSGDIQRIPGLGRLNFNPFHYVSRVSQTSDMHVAGRFIERPFFLDMSPIPGLSGSPVVHVASGRVVGVLIGDMTTKMRVNGNTDASEVITLPAGLARVAPINYPSYWLQDHGLVERNKISFVFYPLLTRRTRSSQRQ